MTRPAPAPSEESSVDFVQYVRTVLRGAKGAVAGLGVGLLAAGAYLVLTPTEYTATATVNVNVISSTPFAPSRAASEILDPATEAAIARSDAVARIALDNHPDENWSVSSLRGTITVTPVADSTVLHISSASDDADAARDQADAVAAAYIEYRGREAETRTATIVEGLLDSIAEIGTEQAAAQARFDSAPANSPARARARSEIRVASQELESLRAKRNELAGLDTRGGSVINPAGESAVSASPSPLTVLAAGGLAGGALGLVVAILNGLLHRRVHGLHDLTDSGVVDAGVSLSSRRAAPPADPADIESMRTLRERIRLVDGTSATVLLVLDDTGSGRVGDVPATLALVLAQNSDDAHLVGLGSDEERREQAVRLLGLEGAPDDELETSQVPGVGFIFTRPVSSLDEPDSLLTRDARHTIAKLVASPGVILVHLSASAPESTRLAVMDLCDAACFVLRRGRSRLTDIHRWATEARERDAAYVAAVLVGQRRLARDGRTPR